MHGSAHASWGQRADATGEAESNHGPLRAGDIVNHLREDRTCIATTMVDYYGMPQCGPAAWPGRAAAPTLLSSRRAETVEQALAADIRQALGPRFHPRRFVPYVVMHEFEALLFSDCVGLARSVGQPDLASSLQAIRDSFTSPEEIDDSPNTAPSQRIEQSIVRYQKPLHGNWRSACAPYVRRALGFGAGWSTWRRWSLTSRSVLPYRKSQTITADEVAQSHPSVALTPHHSRGTD